MPIPDYQTLMLPLLKFLSDGKEHNLPDATKAISDEYNLSPEERQQLLPSGQQTVIRNRLGWARTYMAKAGLIKSTRRAFWQITSRGKDILATNPDRIDVHFLQQFPEFVQFKDLHHEKEQEVTTKHVDEYNPEEALDRAHQLLAGTGPPGRPISPGPPLGSRYGIIAVSVAGRSSTIIFAHKSAAVWEKCVLSFV